MLGRLITEQFATTQLLDVCVGNCQNLQTLTEWDRIGINTINLLPYLPSSLEVFNTSFPILDIHCIPKFFRQLPSNLPKLREVRFLTMSKKELEGYRWGRDARDELNRRGIEVSFGFAECGQKERQDFSAEVSIAV